MEPLQLANSKKEWVLLVLFFIVLFLVNLLFLYKNYLHFKSDEIIQYQGKIVSISQKENKTILKIKTPEYTFFTTLHPSQPNIFEKGDLVRSIVVTTKVDFFNYLRGFFASTFLYEKLESSPTLKGSIHQYIVSQHQNSAISDIFLALFLAIPLSKPEQFQCATYGISHLLAISGFHLGVILATLYYIFHIPYKPLHQNYFPHRNKRFDLLLFIGFLLFGYLLLIDLAPSFLRSFIMFLLGILFLRSHIKIVSFQTLALVALIALSLYPTLLFSLSFWLSMCGVFYIFLFIYYWHNLPKLLGFIIFNFWIFFIMNPIAHYFFATTSFVQLLSPFATVGFTIFYPFEALLHLVGQGGVFDFLLEFWLKTTPKFWDFTTPLWFFLSYIIVSLGAIFSKIFFYLLNISMLLFNILAFT